MSKYVECALYNSDTKVTLNLNNALYISPTTYKDAKAIISFPDRGGEVIDFYVKDSYEYLKDIALNG